MAKVRRLKPRRTWTNRLAWAVWKQRQKNKERHANGGGGEVCRNVSNFNGVDSYADFDNDIVLSGEFGVSVQINPNSGFDGENVVLGGDGQATYLGYAPSLIFYKIGGTYYTFNIPPITGESSVITIRRLSNNNLQCEYQGQTITIGGSSDTITINRIGANSVTGYLDGDISDISIYDNTNLIIQMPMDELESPSTGNINYINKTGDSDYNAIGYNIITREVCELPDIETHVFVLGGQSNMVGSAVYDGLGDYGSNVYQLTQSGEVFRATSPLDNVGGNTNDMGLTISFCEQYSASNPNINILLVPSALGGSSFLSDDWGVGNWLYDLMKSRTDQAMNSSSKTVLKGFLWHQGENDEGNTNYQTELDAQMNDYKSYCSTYIADIPIILGQLAPAFVGTNPDRQDVQDVITDTPGRLVNSATALSTDLPVFDGTHFDSASLRTLGERYYEQYNDLTSIDNLVSGDDDIVYQGDNVVV